MDLLIYRLDVSDFSYTRDIDDSTLRHWEDLARVHGTRADRYYDLERPVQGETLMGTDERAALDRASGGRGRIGLDVLHLQCHIGCDAITMAREEARSRASTFRPSHRAGSST